MLFKITQLSLLLPSFITLAFHSLARWSLERDVETGSSLRFGGKGLLFKTCITATLYGNAALFPCPAPCLGVSYCSWIAGLAGLGEISRDAFVRKFESSRPAKSIQPQTTEREIVLF